MHALIFWKNWPNSNKFLYLFFLCLLAFSLILLFFQWFSGLENVIHWDILSELGELPVTLDTFKTPNETLSIPAKAFIVTEQFVASPMHINKPASYFYAVLLILSFLLILSALTDLPKFWYTIGMAGIIFWLSSLNLDLYFGHSGRYVTIFLIIVFGGISYFFHAFKSNIHILNRFLTFGGITVLLALVYFLIGKKISGAGNPEPLLFLISYAFPGALLISIVFAFIVSYEIVRGFLFISTSSGSQQPLTNFFIGSLFYLANILLVFLHNNKTIYWDIIYFNPFLLLAISTLLGIWGLKHRKLLYEKIFRFDSVGAFLYLGLAIITISTTGFAFATANEPIIETLEDGITYSHLVMGILFIFYVLANFHALFAQKLDVSKVVFKPLSIPLTAFRIGALITIVALLSMRNFFPLNQAFSGYYNQLGDLYTAQKDLKFAEIEYKSAAAFDGWNHKTNYALASLALNQGDNETAALYFKKALTRDPSPFAFEGLSRSFYDEDHFFEAMFTLKEGLQKFPENGELQNNLAYLYAKSNLVDSAVIYYNLAEKNAGLSNVVKSNIIAFWAKNGKRDTQKEIGANAERNDYPSFQGNLWALSLVSEQENKDHLEFFKTSDKQDQGLSVSDFSWLYNQTIAQKSTGENLPLQKIAEKEDNESVAEDLLFAETIQEYYKGNKIIAFQKLSARATGDTTSKKNRYFQILLNTLVKKESRDTNISSEGKTIEQLIQQNPLNTGIVKKAIDFYNNQKKSNDAYNIALNAISWRKNSPELYKLYILQSLEIGMKDYAHDGLEKLQKLSATDYQHFLPTYQAKLSSIEKQSAGFQ
ncbi:Flp pilus assembly protein TadD, contains TPR repeats [Pseudarcicella hirudinis]|uniref:Flp pilus assembly protein TadD, contains TPR repeats n=1 Tax=Pseudarcicella hirudinis TaxID=1079859 RepID=A0A1I5Q975_9BACT|nr:hypothetical protein [Pseudarcicella hirudinis]SFP42600.1 Flp pilus assembly protein TadD, contains TPR repeats [Pseudarcicella hirudinis]